MNPTTKLVFNSRRLLFAVIACLLLVGCLTTRIQDAIAPLPDMLTEIRYLAADSRTNQTIIVNDALLTLSDVRLTMADWRAFMRGRTIEGKRLPWVWWACAGGSLLLLLLAAQVIRVLILTADETLIPKTRTAWGEKQKACAPHTQKVIRWLVKAERRFRHD